MQNHTIEEKLHLDQVDFDALRKTHRGVIGIISMGDMGSGIARLLTAHNYAVVTNVSDRSEDTQSRARSTGAILLPSDQLLVQHSDVILSIVPPASALSTAQRITSSLVGDTPLSSEGKTLYYADLNAVSPSTVKSISSLFDSHPNVKFIDGSILGGPPSLSLDDDDDTPKAWTKPLIPTSGPFSFSSVYDSPELSAILRAKHISDKIGQASGLKMVFASLSKGYAAVALQSITTAQQLGVLPELVESVTELQGGAAGRKLERAVTGLAPKAGRWEREMKEIGRTHRENGGWGREEGIFEAAAEIYRAVATETVLGREKIGRREKGTTVEGVAVAVAEGLEKRKARGE
ncbi:6-phosphogluconate dehydrogenase [Apiosordaria backusii]|uniref:6-phosphogluconate dehydrogenase n=1 Tax=Apiosordaria backusii TaxID=314023 RepID=A0AA40B7S0_9PEZI|nr:6-phosphogluconate dehydrogenase [Apiosordaria backusii]